MPFVRRRGSTLEGGITLYFTDRGIEELEERRGDEQVSLAWVADRLRAFVDASPEHAGTIERLATFLARDDADED